MADLSTDTYLRLFLPGYAIAARVYELGNPGKTLDVGKAITTGEAKNLVADKIVSNEPQPLDFLESFIDQGIKDPRNLANTFRATTLAATVGLALLSLVPTEANFGGPAAARLLDRFLEPFFRKIYGGPIENYLQSYFPTAEVAPRMLVSAVEAGTIEEGDLLEQLIEGGIKPASRDIVLKLARYKRFEAATKDDMALLRSYQSDLTRAHIQTRQDELKVVVADLKAQRKELQVELRKVRASQVVA